MSRRKFGVLAGSVVLAAAVVAGYGWYAAMRRHHVIDAVRARMGAWGGYAYRESNRDSFLEPYRARLGPSVVDFFSGSRGNQVGAWGTGASKAQLAEALDAEPLKTVFFGGAANLDDDWVAGIREPETLLCVHLEGTGITDRSLDRIERMRNLIQLGVVDTALTDAALFRLLKMPSITSLYYGGPNLRAVRLAEHRVLDDSGGPAVHAGGPIRIVGRIELSGLDGQAYQVRVFVRPAGDRLSWEAIPYGWNVRYGDVVPVDRAKDGSLEFETAFPQLPEGRSSVEIWLDYDHVRFRLPPFTIDLEPPKGSSDESRSPKVE